MNIMQIFRQHEKKIIFGLAIVTAVAFGITTQMQAILTGKSDENIAGKIMGKKISILEFQTRQNQCQIWTKYILAHYNKEIKPSLILSMRPPFDMADADLYEKKQDEYLNQLTWVALLMDALADKAGIKVTPQEIVDAIKQDFIFREAKDNSSASENQERVFSPDQYIRVVNNYFQISDVAFEETVGEFLKIDKYRTFVLSAITANNKEAYDEFITKNEEMRVNWLAFNPADFEKKIEVKSDDELAKYFNDHQQDYEVPEQIQIEYIIALNDKIQKELSIPEESVQSYYTKNREKEYPVRSYAEARDEIKNKLASDEAKDQIKIRIDGADKAIQNLVALEKKIDFKELAQRFNLEYHLTGFVEATDVKNLEKELGASSYFEKQITTLAENEPSQTFSTDKGDFICMVAKRQEKYIPKFDDQIKSKVKHDYIKDKADEAAKAAADQLVKDINDKVQGELKDKKDDENLKSELRKKWFESLAQGNKDGVKLEKTSYFGKSENPTLPKPYNLASFKESLFDKKVNEFDVFKGGNIYYLAQVADKRMPDPMKFDSELKDLQDTVASKKKKDFVKKWLDDIKKQTNFEDIMAKAKKANK